MFVFVCVCPTVNMRLLETFSRSEVEISCHLRHKEEQKVNINDPVRMHFFILSLVLEFHTFLKTFFPNPVGCPPDTNQAVTVEMILIMKRLRTVTLLTSRKP